jgi:hypothetical protein
VTSDVTLNIETHFVEIFEITNNIRPQVIALSPYYCVLSGEVTNTNFIVFGLVL